MEKDIIGRGGKGGGELPAGKVLIDRKTVERNRRQRTKDLYAQLFSLVPPQHFTTSKGMLSLQDRIACATSYIKQLRERVEEQRARREQAVIVTSTSQEYNKNGDHRRMVEPEELRLPVLELKEITGCGLQVNFLISKSCSSKNDKCSSTSCTILLSRSIRILHEEGAEVVSASFVHRGSKVFYTIHAQVKVPRVGVETSRVRTRLEELLALV